MKDTFVIEKVVDSDIKSILQEAWALGLKSPNKVGTPSGKVAAIDKVVKDVMDSLKNSPQNTTRKNVVSFKGGKINYTKLIREGTVRIIAEVVINPNAPEIAIRNK
tara:strand:+ start:7232 stop:7549 length:318 start_codon:yes stop_codon:yes gene_type:complete